MRRVHSYSKKYKQTIELVKYGSLAIGLLLFWAGVIFHSKINVLSNQICKKGFYSNESLEIRNHWGPYSDALARNFTKASKK